MINSTVVLWKKENNKKKEIGIFTDLSKAFDTIYHKILIIKLENYVVKGINLQWLQSQIESRKKFIAYENFSKSDISVSYGVR